MSDDAQDDLAADPQAFMRDQRRKRRRVWVLSTVGVLLAGGVFGAGLWTAYQVGYEHGAQEAAPVITSEGDTVRVQPEDEGGRDVENEDSEVYALLEEDGEGEQSEEVLVPEEGEAPAESGDTSDAAGGGDGAGTDSEGSGESAAGSADGDGQAAGEAGGDGAGAEEEDIAVESLDEPAEEPSFEEGQGEDEIETLIDEEVAQTGDEADGQAADGDTGTTQTAAAEDEAGSSDDAGASAAEEDGGGSAGGDTAGSEGAETADSASADSAGSTNGGEAASDGGGDGAANEDDSAAGDGEEVAARASEGPSQPDSKPAETGGNWRIQVGSVSERDVAESEWQRLQDRYADVLGDLEPTYQRADLGEDGVYHRIQAGSLAESRAREICQQLSEQDQGCLVIAP